MLRKWLVPVVAAAVMAVGFCGCEGDTKLPSTPKETEAPKRGTGGAADVNAPATSEKAPAPAPGELPEPASQALDNMVREAVGEPWAGQFFVDMKVDMQAGRPFSRFSLTSKASFSVKKDGDGPLKVIPITEAFSIELSKPAEFGGVSLAVGSKLRRGQGGKWSLTGH